MADIRDKILKKYEIDIKETDLIGLYKISSPDISAEDLEELLSKKRKNWNTFLNSPREDKAKEAADRLSKADIYEEILRDKYLRRELFNYNAKNAPADEFTRFARSFFNVIASSKKISDEDVSFFFSYYKGKSKNKAAVLEMLENEFGLTKRESKTLTKLDDKQEKDEQAEKRQPKEKGSMIVTLFKESTLKDIEKCEEWLEKAKTSSKAVQVFPKANESLDIFLELDRLKDIEAFKSFIKQNQEKAANYRYENGQAFSPIVDIFNTMGELAKQGDVSHNFREFVLLVRYSKLNPYMYEILAPKKETLKALYETAEEYYTFLGFDDFICNYFAPLYKNFGIYENGVRSLINKAEKSKRRDGEPSFFETVSGKYKESNLPLLLKILSVLSDLPLYLSYIIFRAVKAVVWNLRYLCFPVVIYLAPIWAAWVPRLIRISSYSYRETGKGAFLSGILSTIEFIGSLMRAWQISLMNIQESGRIAVVLGGMGVFLFYGILIIMPIILFGRALWQAATKLRKKIDWRGIDKTYVNAINKRREYFKSCYKKLGNKVFAGAVLSAALSIVILGGIGFGIKGAAGALGGIYTLFNYPSGASSSEYVQLEEEYTDETKMGFEDQRTAEITVSAANIRSGPGTDYSVLNVAKRGERFLLTGEMLQPESGSFWYQIYVDLPNAETGWLSESVMEISGESP